MKITMLSLLLFSVITIYAQEKVTVTERKITIGKTLVNVMTVPVGNNSETIKKSFIRYSKKTLKIKVKKENKALIAEKVGIPLISDKIGDLKAISFEENGKIILGVGFLLGYEISINSTDYPAEAARLKEFTRKFAIYHETEYFQEILNEDQKRLQELVRKMKKNQSEFNALTKKIENIDKTIRKEKESDKKLDLNNQNINNRARVQALNDIIGNLRKEIAKIGDAVERTKKSIRKLENEMLEEQE